VIGWLRVMPAKARLALGEARRLQSVSCLSRNGRCWWQVWSVRNRQCRPSSLVVSIFSTVYMPGQSRGKVKGEETLLGSLLKIAAEGARAILLHASSCTREVREHDWKHRMLKRMLTNADRRLAQGSGFIPTG
jgi:hypothetical protein